MKKNSAYPVAAANATAHQLLSLKLSGKIAKSVTPRSAGGTKQPTNWRQFVKRVGDTLEKGLVTAFQSTPPQKELQVNDAIEAILGSFDDQFVREFPMFK